MNAINELAPTGVLRAGMNLGNTLFTRQNEAGELHGVSVDLMQALAKRLGVSLEMLIYEQPGQVADDAPRVCGTLPFWPLKKRVQRPFRFLLA